MKQATWSYRFTIWTMPVALRCASCMFKVFQAFRDDGQVVADKECSACNGKGSYPIPPYEVGCQ